MRVVSVLTGTDAGPSEMDPRILVSHSTDDILRFLPSASFTLRRDASMESRARAAARRCHSTPQASTSAMIATNAGLFVSRRIRIICSSLYRVFFMSLSLSKRPLSQDTLVRKSLDSSSLQDRHRQT